MFYVTKELLLIAKIFPGCIEIQNEPCCKKEEAPELELKYIANGVELQGDNFVEALRNEISWEKELSFDIDILAAEDNDLAIDPIPINPDDVVNVLPTVRPTGDEEKDNINAWSITSVSGHLENSKCIEMVLDDDGYVMFDNDNNIICTNGKHLMTFFYYYVDFVYTDDNNDICSKIT